MDQIALVCQHSISEGRKPPTLVEPKMGIMMMIAPEYPPLQRSTRAYTTIPITSDTS